MELGRKKLRLGDVLIEAGALNDKQLKKALEIQKSSGKKLGETLVEEGMVSEEQIVRALSAQLRLDAIELQNVKIADDILALVPPNVLRKHKMIPFEYSKVNPNVIRVAMSDPMDMYAMDDIMIVTNLQVEAVVATTASIMLALDKYYGHDEVDTALKQYAKEKEEETTVEEELTSEDVNRSPIVVMVKTLMKPLRD